MGVIGDCTPEITTLIAYCDYEGNLIVKKMNVQDVLRLKRLDDERSRELKKKIYERGFDIVARNAKLSELYIPKKNFYVILNDGEYGNLSVGIYLESKGCSHHFLLS